MRVLLVEDEVRLAENVRRGLAAEGFVVDVVHDGAEGLFRGQVNDYDVIVLDIMLPGSTATRSAGAARPAHLDPVLMLTAKDGEYDQTDALDLGADDYLTKPFSFLVLVARLRALCAAGRRRARRARRSATSRWTRRAGTVCRGGRRIALTPREFAVLRLPHAPHAARWSPSRRSSSTSGTPPSRATRTSSRSTSATCAARSTSRSAGTRSRRSAAWATGWRPEVAEPDVGAVRWRDRCGVRRRAALAATVRRRR